MRQALTDQGLTIAVEVIEPAAGGAWTPDEALAEVLQQRARATAVLPMTGQAPDWSQGEWSQGSPAEALRNAGLTYLARVQTAG